MLSRNSRSAADSRITLTRNQGQRLERCRAGRPEPFQLSHTHCEIFSQLSERLGRGCLDLLAELGDLLFAGHPLVVDLNRPRQTLNARSAQRRFQLSSGIRVGSS